jgi:hypothetical protein
MGSGKYISAASFCFAGTLTLLRCHQVCVCRYDWETFPERFADATNIDEINFYEYLIDVVQPQVTAVFRVRSTLTFGIVCAPPANYPPHALARRLRRPKSSKKRSATASARRASSCSRVRRRSRSGSRLPDERLRPG